MVHFWCSFGAFAPKVHQTAGALSALLHQKCTKTAQGNGALLALLHQKCTRNAPPLESAPYGQNASKVHQKRCTFGSFSPKVHQKCTLHWCTFWRFCTKKSTKTAPVLRRSYWRFGKNWKIFPKKFQKNLTGSENFPRIFRNFSKSPVTPPEHWCSFGALLVQQHHKCTRPSSVLLRQDYRQAGETARHSDPRPRPLQLVEDLFWGVALQLPQELSALGLSVGPRPRSSVQSLAHSCAP